MGVARFQFYLSIPSWLLLATLPNGGPDPAGTSQSAGVVRDLDRQQAPTTQIILTFSAKQEPVINGQLVPWQQLDQQVRAIYDLRPRKVLIVKADSTKDRDALARVLRIAKRRGVTVEIQARTAG
jgi:biopolymer transport protein ExbD